MLPAKLAFIDVETTGLSVTRDRIIEVGIVRVENNKVVHNYSQVINPQMYISPYITHITGITSEELENAPTFEEVYHQISEMLEGCVFVAHNVRFDYGFIRNEFRRLEQRFVSKHFCTAKLSRALFPRFQRHNLDSIIERYNLSCERRHRALDDAQVLWQFFQIVQSTYSPEKIEEAIAVGMKRPARPLQVAESEIKSLPELPGVYTFYGENDAVLYVGKSVNIKERVLSHFASDHTSGREMKLSQLVRHITTYTTAGELGALLKEAQLIKELQPLYNRKLRTSRRLVVLKANEKSGYHTIVMEELTDINPHDISSLRGVFRSKKQAKDFLLSVVKEHRLCEKLVGLEKTKGACFQYRLGLCNGACVGKENPLRYNTRSILAFSRFRFRDWPFPGAVVITEKNEDTKEIDQFVVDIWCLLGKHTIREDAHNLFSSQDYRFDVDTYKILVRYIEKHIKNISLLPPSRKEKVQVQVESQDIEKELPL